MKLKEINQVVQAVGPIIKNAFKSGQLFRPACELTEPDPDILCEYDVKIPMSDGYNVTANIYRSKKVQEKGEKVPVVMCAHPYDNHITPALGNTPLGGAPQQYRIIPQAGKPVFSKLTSWESPDPNFWIPAGYAIVNMNMPGYSNSEGYANVFGESQAKCYYEAIEWVAKQPWCTGKIGLSGVSFLAISQYHVAACQAYGGPPPSLKCISPWEGLSDAYRDMFTEGGVTEIGFPTFWWHTEVKSTINGTKQDFIKSEGCIPPDYSKQNPFYDDFWKEKTAKLEEITLPMLICCSFSDQGLHTRGSFRAFEKASSKQKWAYTHRGGKWDVYYSPEVQKLTKEFMDCFLKNDTSSGFLDNPPIRLEVRSSRDEIHEVRYENEWPLARTEYTKLYLSDRSLELSIEKPERKSEIIYPAKKGKVVFNYKFEEDTELTGYMKLRVWVETRSEKEGGDPSDDMVIFIATNKLDKNGKSVRFYGSVGSNQDMLTRGLLKVSRRELDSDKSTEWQAVLKGTSEKKLAPGEIVPVDIGTYPQATFFSKGETLQLIIASNEIISSPPYKKDVKCNHGNHVLHCGGKYESYLLVPKIPPQK